MVGFICRSAQSYTSSRAVYFKCASNHLKLAKRYDKVYKCCVAAEDALVEGQIGITRCSETWVLESRRAWWTCPSCPRSYPALQPVS